MLTALVVGALTAWYLGMKLGVIAAAVSFVALVVAGVLPGMTLTVYAVIIGWCALLYFFGAKLRGQQPPSVARTMTGSAVGTVGKWVGKARKMFSGGPN